MAEDAPKDTMHSGPQAAPEEIDLTSNPVSREMAAKGLSKPAPPPNTQGEQSTITVGEFDPEPGSTLVTDIPGEEDREPAEPLNPGNPAPEQPVAKQPFETADEAGKRAAEADKPKATAAKK